MGVATLLAWLGFYIILGSFNPFSANLVVFVLFYIVLFLAALGTLSLLGFWFRVLFFRQRVVPRLMITEAWRQGFIFAVIFIIAMWLQAGRVLTWWNMVLLVVLGTVAEFMFVVFKRDNR